MGTTDATAGKEGLGLVCPRFILPISRAVRLRVRLVLAGERLSGPHAME